MKNLLSVLLLTATVGSLNSCYYDIEEELYPAYSTNTCDTVNVSYSQIIQPLLNSACNSCHGTGIGLGNVTLGVYSDLQPYIASGSLLGSVEHTSGFSPMPKGGNPLSDCSTAMLRAWINQGALNN